MVINRSFGAKAHSNIELNEYNFIRLIKEVFAEVTESLQQSPARTVDEFESSLSGVIRSPFDVVVMSIRRVVGTSPRSRSQLSDS